MPIDSILEGEDIPSSKSMAPLREGGAAPYEFRLIAQPGVRGMEGATRGISETELRERLHAGRLDAFEQGRLEGERVAREAAEASAAAAIAQERERVANTIQGFCETRNRYFAEAEQEVVRLSLAIAARILHREVQLDPLVLSSVVRVALDKLAGSGGITLRVPMEQIAAWQKIVQRTDNSDERVVTGDPSLAAGDCVLETRMGTVELGIAAQLQEIERGFFDLLNRRPVS